MLGTSIGNTAANETLNPYPQVVPILVGGDHLINKISKIYSLSDSEMLYEKVKQERGIRMGKAVTLSKMVEKASCMSKTSKEVVPNNRKEEEEGINHTVTWGKISKQRKQQKLRF